MKVVCLFFLLLFMALPLAQAGEIYGRVLHQDGDAPSPSPTRVVICRN
ncbi:MAG: hypothetical protein IH935_10250 [Acidobacteria bacterium]|nr:hypothetical protein [Acidobacteriota bacterium]